MRSLKIYILIIALGIGWSGFAEDEEGSPFASVRIQLASFVQTNQSVIKVMNSNPEVAKLTFRGTTVAPHLAGINVYRVTLMFSDKLNNPSKICTVRVRLEIKAPGISGVDQVEYLEPDINCGPPPNSNSN